MSTLELGAAGLVPLEVELRVTRAVCRVAGFEFWLERGLLRLFWSARTRRPASTGGTLR